ncbi:Initiator Replication protein [Paraburkholderia hospita]|nr:Initiator Replication protein [Paraburkholderia hospita]
MSVNISLWDDLTHRNGGGGRAAREMSGLTWVSAQVLSFIYFTAYSNTKATATDTGKEFVSHEVDVKLFAWLMGIESDEMGRLEQMLMSAQKVSYVETGKRRTSSEYWLSIPLVSTVSRMGSSRMWVDVRTDLLRYLRSQESPGALPVDFKPDLSSVYARSLYANLARHEHQEGCSTDWIPLDAVRAWPGKSRASVARAEDFLKRVVAPAIREINEVSDVEMQCETVSDEPDSKDISVRFAVTRKDPTVMRWDYLRIRSELFSALNANSAPALLTAAS